jgi:hypothetical protein
MRKPARIDPPGCGCTDCDGYSVPLDLATTAHVLAMLSGRLHDATSTPFEVQLVIRSTYDHDMIVTN